MSSASGLYAPQSGRETPEYSSAQRLVALQSSQKPLEDCVPRACTKVDRQTCKTADLATSLVRSLPASTHETSGAGTHSICLLAFCQAGLGCPLIITDAFSHWPALSKWTLDFFRQHHGSLPIRVNDRAPARHADALPGGGGVQRTVVLALASYIDYMEERSLQAAAATAPFYLNGWAAFHEVPALAEDCPGPAFLEGIDHTAEILLSLDKALCRTGVAGSAKARNGGGQLLDIISMTGRLKKARRIVPRTPAVRACISGTPSPFLECMEVGTFDASCRRCSWARPAQPRACITTRAQRMATSGRSWGANYSCCSLRQTPPTCTGAACYRAPEERFA